MYGPSAATGVAAGSTGVFFLSNEPTFAALAAFTLIGAAFAIKRMLPTSRRAGARRA